MEAAIEIGPAATPDGETGFFVRDNGVGFDMAYAGGLFGPFRRVAGDGARGVIVRTGAPVAQCEVAPTGLGAARARSGGLPADPGDLL